MNSAPFFDLMNDQTVTEILVNRYNQIWFERSGILQAHSQIFESPLTYQHFLNQMCVNLGLEVSIEKPTAEGQHDGFRIQMISEHITRDSTGLSFRRLGGHQWDLNKLHQSGFLSEKSKEALVRLLVDKKNLLIVGETGCGKTTLLNTLTRSLPDNERLIFIEDTDELVPTSPCSLKMLTRKNQPGGLSEISLSDLVRFSLRLRPDRLIIGEVRGPEAKDLLLALSTGHQGSLGTLHASSGQQALLRLEMLVQLGAPQWSKDTVRKLISLSLDGIVVVGKTNGGVRALKKIELIQGYEETGLLLETMFEQ